MPNSKHVLITTTLAMMAATAGSAARSRWSGTAGTGGIHFRPKRTRHLKKRKTRRAMEKATRRRNRR